MGYVTPPDHCAVGHISLGCRLGIADVYAQLGTFQNRLKIKISSGVQTFSKFVFQNQSGLHKSTILILF